LSKCKALIKRINWMLKYVIIFNKT
jgi:hypothetical protein